MKAVIDAQPTDSRLPERRRGRNSRETDAYPGPVRDPDLFEQWLRDEQSQALTDTWLNRKW